MNTIRIKQYQNGQVVMIYHLIKRVFDESLKETIRRDPKLDKFYVHASPYSIPIYRKLGFIKTDKMQEENGIKYLPMEITINK
jgi:predicted GNAT family N-acyltransferase